MISKDPQLQARRRNLQDDWSNLCATASRSVQERQAGGQQENAHAREGLVGETVSSSLCKARGDLQPKSRFFGPWYR